MMTNNKWSKEQVEQAYHAGRRPMMIRYPDGAVKDCTRKFVATLNGNYHVEETKYEIIVSWKPIGAS